MLLMLVSIILFQHQFWGNPLHVLDVLYSLLMDYVHNPSFVSIYER